MHSVFTKPGTKVDVYVEDRRSSFTFSIFSLPRLLPWGTASSQSREQRSMSMWRTGEAPLLSRYSLCPGCFPGVQRLRKAGNKGRCLCGGPKKLLYFLDVLFVPFASLGGMYSVFTMPGTKVDVDVEDRTSSFTFSMFSLPRLLPWAGCTASSQSREQESMSMWRTGEAPLLSRCSLCPGCFPGRDVQRLRKARNRGWSMSIVRRSYRGALRCDTVKTRLRWRCCVVDISASSHGAFVLYLLKGRCFPNGQFRAASQELRKIRR
jgi:hypothetical protein